MKRNPLIISIGALLILLFLVLLFTFQVRTTQVAVVTTFGNPTRPIQEPGAYFKWPWPIQEAHKFDKRVQSFEDKFTQDYTADKNTLLTSVYIGWRIADAQAFFPKFTGGSSENSVAEAERILQGLVRSAKTQTVGRHPLADFVSVAGGGTNFIAIENEMLAAVQSQVRSNQYGIEVEFLGIKRIGFPENVTQDVFGQMKSERQVQVELLRREGEAEAQKIRSDAERRAAEILAAAEGQASEIRGQGYFEAAKSLEAFRQNPELAGFLFRLEALENLLNERTTLIFDQQTPPFDLFGGISTNRPAR